MLSLFNRNKAHLNSITIPDFGWSLTKEEEGMKQWMPPEQTMALSLHYFKVKPDLPTIQDMAALRNFYRRSLRGAQGGLIQVDKIDLKGFTAIKTIFKFPQQPSGTTYLGSLTLPFERCSFVIKFQAPEIEASGSREAVVSAKMLKAKTIQLGPNGMEGWMLDPYDPKRSVGTLMNRSEAPEYDADFPSHPLTHVRNVMAKIESDVLLDTKLSKVREFKL